MPLRDRGLQPLNTWRVDERLVRDLKSAVLSKRKKDSFGPRKRQRLVFRASELGDLVSYRDYKGDPGGCARKVFYDFWPEEYERIPLDAETLLNFAMGYDVEDKMEAYLIEAGLLMDKQVKLGAWSSNPDAPAYMQADPRYPDKSRGLVRGKADFIIRHPEHGLIPLEYKSSSTYMFGAISDEGPKSDNGLQIQFYGHEMGTSHVAIGYTNKEDGNFVIFTSPTQHKLIEEVLDTAERRKEAILAGRLPPMPVGIKGPEHFYDRAWPCYSYARKKGRVMPCAFFKYCHGELPKKEDYKPKKRATKKRASKKKAAKKRAAKKKAVRRTKRR